jgi:hypothetical protein
MDLSARRIEERFGKTGQIMSDTTTSLTLKGTVVAVASNARHEFTKPTKETIRLVEDHGVEGDAHSKTIVKDVQS